MSYMNYLENLIDGNISFDKSKLITYTKEKKIIESDIVPNETKLISLKTYENLFVTSANKIIREFIKSDYNKNVYILYLFIDLENGSAGLSLGTDDSYKEILENSKRKIPKEDENTILGYKYSEGDLKYRFYNEEFLAPDLEEVSNAYFAIKNDQPFFEVKNNITFEKNIFEARLITAGLNTLISIKESIDELKTTDDFIISLSLHDVSIEIEKKLLQSTNDIELLKEKFIEFK